MIALSKGRLICSDPISRVATPVRIEHVNVSLLSLAVQKRLFHGPRPDGEVISELHILPCAMATNIIGYSEDASA